jgi:hypothetical protein
MQKRELVHQGKLPEEGPQRTHTDHSSGEEKPLRLLHETRSQIGLSLAGIHTTSNLLTNAYQAYIQSLRNTINYGRRRG